MTAERDKLPPCPSCEEHQDKCRCVDPAVADLDKKIDEILNDSWPLTDRACDVNDPEDCDSCQ